MDRLRAMDEDAWRRFVRVYGPLVRHWCREHGLQDADAEDVGQNVLRSVANAIGKFDRRRGPGSFRAWLRVVTINKVRDFARKNAGEPSATGGSDAAAMLGDIADPASLAEDASDPASAAEREQLLKRSIEALLAECEEGTRQAFWRVVVERQSASETAKELGMTVNAVYLAKSRILRRLRDEFADLVDLSPSDAAQAAPDSTAAHS